MCFAEKIEVLGLIAEWIVISSLISSLTVEIDGGQEIKQGMRAYIYEF